MVGRSIWPNWVSNEADCVTMRVGISHLRKRCRSCQSAWASMRTRLSASAVVEAAMASTEIVYVTVVSAPIFMMHSSEARSGPASLTLTDDAESDSAVSRW